MMTRKTFCRVLIAFCYLAATGDLSGFRFMIPRGMKERYPVLDEINRATLKYLRPEMVEDFSFGRSLLLDALR